MKLVHFDDLPKDLSGNACAGCPFHMRLTHKSCRMACAQQAKAAELRNYGHYVYFDELTYITWKLKK